MVFSFCGNFLPRNIHGLAFRYVETHSPGITPNRPFPSSVVPLFQSESKCKTILMKMTLICMKMKLHAELIFI